MEEGEKNTLVQQRIKKMLENKKKLANRDETEHAKRLKSGANTQNKLHEAETEEQIGKPHSSIRMRRPASAFKAVQSTHGVPVIPIQKVEIDCRALLKTVFDHGVKLQQYLNRHHLDPEKYHEYLSNNELFVMLVTGKLKKVTEEKHALVMEKQAIAKMQRDMEVRAQLQRCEEVEQRISQRLEDRLKMLSKQA